MRGFSVVLVLVFASIVALVIQEAQANLHEKISSSMGESMKRTFRRMTSSKDIHSKLKTEIGSESNHIDSMVASQEPKADFTAKCFRQHEPDFVQPPVVHFFSPKQHSETTRGCGSNVAIQLEPIGGQMSLKPRLDKAKIRELVIDSGLFNPSFKSYLITHGFSLSWNKDSWLCDLKDLIIDSSRANVFILDWSGGSKLDDKSPLAYGVAVSNSPYVGAVLGEFIRLLVEMSGQNDASQFHVIGHSLGAHVSGFAGYYLNGTLGRITGLDPAGPCFTAGSKTISTATTDGHLDNGSRRLSRQSAQTVIALHTDASLLGLKQNCGHFDVYVNGGHQQPGCDQVIEDYQEKSFGRRVLSRAKSMRVDGSCRHAFVYKIFKQFINGHKLSWSDTLINVGAGETNYKCYLVAYQCSNWEAFKAGECGFCRDGDHDCVLISPSTSSINTTALVDRSNYGSSPPSVIGYNDDGKFNDEGLNDGNHDLLAGSYSWMLDRQQDHSNGQHFLRSGTVPTICTYHYQIIVAVRRQPGAASRPEITSDQFYYLDIPLELSGELTDKQGSRLESRVVQVSHKLTTGSVAYNNIKTKYMMHSKLTTGDLVDTDELDFYTALITFEPITDSDKCSPDDTTNGAGGEETRWRICHPLGNIQEARLWSSKRADLHAVAWVGMNYMSGLDFKQRLEGSYVLKPIQEQSINKRGEIVALSKAKQQVELESNDVDLSNEVADSDEYLIRLADAGKSRDPKTREFRRYRINREMLYSMNLRSSRV